MAEVKQEGAHLNLKIVSQVCRRFYAFPPTDASTQDGAEVFFKIKKSTRFAKMFDAFCERQGIDPSSVRFLFDGERIAVCTRCYSNVNAYAPLGRQHSRASWHGGWRQHRLCRDSSGRSLAVIFVFFTEFSLLKDISE